jgi:hypothetical protein
MRQMKPAAALLTALLLAACHPRTPPVQPGQKPPAPQAAAVTPAARPQSDSAPAAPALTSTGDGPESLVSPATPGTLSYVHHVKPRSALACAEQADLQKLATVAAQTDQQEFGKNVAAYVTAGECIMLQHNEVVFLPLGKLQTLSKIRAGSQGREYWLPSEYID